MDITCLPCRLAIKPEPREVPGPLAANSQLFAEGPLLNRQSNVSDNYPVVKLQTHGQGTGNEGSIQSGRVLDDCITVRMRCWCHRAACKAAVNGCVVACSGSPMTHMIGPSALRPTPCLEWSSQG